MGDIRRVTETTVRHRHFVSVEDVISLLNLRVNPGSIILSVTPTNLDHLGGVPGLLIVTQDPATETAPEDVRIRSSST